MALRIGIVAPPWFELPPRGYGGIEWMCHWLTEALVARGHDVTLVGAGRGGAEQFICLLLLDLEGATNGSPQRGVPTIRNRPSPPSSNCLLSCSLAAMRPTSPVRLTNRP